MFEGWDSFYILIGGAAGALIGLLFVVVTLTADLRPEGTDDTGLTLQLGTRLYVTPSLLHFASVLLLSALAMMPTMTRLVMSIGVGAVGVFGVGYSFPVTTHLITTRYTTARWTDPWFYGVFPTAAYLCLVIAAVALWIAMTVAPTLLGVGVILLLFIGIRDTWDVATWVTQNRPGSRAAEADEQEKRAVPSSHPTAQEQSGRSLRK